MYVWCFFLVWNLVLIRFFGCYFSVYVAFSFEFFFSLKLRVFFFQSFCYSVGMVTSILPNIIFIYITLTRNLYQFMSDMISCGVKWNQTPVSDQNMSHQWYPIGCRKLSTSTCICCSTICIIHYLTSWICVFYIYKTSVTVKNILSKKLD